MNRNRDGSKKVNKSGAKDAHKRQVFFGKGDGNPTHHEIGEFERKPGDTILDRSISDYPFTIPKEDDTTNMITAQYTKQIEAEAIKLFETAQAALPEDQRTTWAALTNGTRGSYMRQANINAQPKSAKGTVKIQ